MSTLSSCSSVFGLAALRRSVTALALVSSVLSLTACPSPPPPLPAEAPPVYEEPRDFALPWEAGTEVEPSGVPIEPPPQPLEPQPLEPQPLAPEPLEPPPADPADAPPQAPDAEPPAPEESGAAAGGTSP